ncbi:unnamed protein product, partial [Ascophyllum nodosum]
MIPTVLGPIEPSSVEGSCSAHEYLRYKPLPADVEVAHQNPLTLANLSNVRSCGDDGRFSVSNKLFSLDESAQELAALVDASGALVVECATVGHGRDPGGLVEISRRSNVGVVMAASWRRVRATIESEAKPLPNAETIGRELERQLLFGEHVDGAAYQADKAQKRVPTRVQAGVIVVELGDRYSSRKDLAETLSVIADEAVRALEGAAWVQRATSAPLIIVFHHFVRWEIVESAFAIATAQLGCDATPGKIILAGMHGGVTQCLRDHLAMLTKGVVLCFDCFGRVEWLPGPEYYPADEESAVRIAELARQGFARQIVMSQGVSRRIHLSRFGGHGYGHALRTVPSRLRRLGMSEDEIALMTRGTMLRLLDWYTPPPPLEPPKEYLPCSWCKNAFEPVAGEYFHKFQFVYCGMKCLRLHRDTGFDA